ncbi:MAG: hypothetical protein H6704_31245 [Myxococcales bacterium]|nr:hypothetical protein [Myxococcales bacterium]
MRAEDEMTRMRTRTGKRRGRLARAAVLLMLMFGGDAVADEDPTSQPAAPADEQAAAAEEKPNPAAVALVEALVAALREPDEAKRAAAVLPLLHRSLLNEAGDDLDPFVRRYSFAKASAGVRFLARPVRVVQVRRGRPVTLGFGPTAERGRSDLYFVARPDGPASSPAPVAVFFPADGGAPGIADFGSL